MTSTTLAMGRCLGRHPPLLATNTPPHQNRGHEETGLNDRGPSDLVLTNLGHRRDPASSDSLDALIADGSRLFRAGLRTLIEIEADIAVAGEAATGEQAVALARETQPDVVLMDMHLPVLSGIEATRRICSDLPYVKVLILATVARDEEISHCLEAGASGLLTKDIEPPELLAAIHVVAAGGIQLSPPFMSHVIDKLSSSNEHHQSLGPPDGGEPDPPVPIAFQQLTAREREVVELVALGLTNCEIADRLIVSPKTAKTHVSRAMTKLGVHHRAALVATAYQNGLVDATATPTRDEAHHERGRQPSTRS
jgi:DNA-binding NarL/FixJ family response regulator